MNPDQMLRSRWISKWKSDDHGSKKAKARLVVLGYLDPKLTEVARDSPALSKEGRATILQCVASSQYELISFDITTAFLRGKADSENPLAMESSSELRQKLGMSNHQVCELLGNLRSSRCTPTFLQGTEKAVDLTGISKPSTRPMYLHAEIH